MSQMPSSDSTATAGSILQGSASSAVGVLSDTGTNTAITGESNGLSESPSVQTSVAPGGYIQTHTTNTPATFTTLSSLGNEYESSSQVDSITNGTYCSLPQDLSNTIKFGDEYVWKSVVIYTCMSGFVFSDGNSTKVITCERNGVWNATVTPCTKGKWLRYK